METYLETVKRRESGMLVLSVSKIFSNSWRNKMVILERIIHQIHPDKWPEVNAMEVEFDKVEKPLGFTEKKRYRMIVGGEGTNTLVIERHWPSMAAMEAAYDKAMANPGWQALGAKSGVILTNTRYEILMVLP
jgi:hypothetical protein